MSAKFWIVLAAAQALAQTVIGPAGNHRVINVSTPTLTAYLPDSSNATGTAVIIAPPAASCGCR